MDDIEYDDGSSVAHISTSKVRYCISKEEYPQELLRTFDIVWAPSFLNNSIFFYFNNHQYHDG